MLSDQFNQDTPRGFITRLEDTIDYGFVDVAAMDGWLLS